MSIKDTLLRATGDLEVKSHTSAEFKTFLELHRWFPFKKKNSTFFMQGNVINCEITRKRSS